MPTWDSNFGSQLNDMLAPYQAQAQQLNNPYATMSQNSWLAQNHPGVAHVLDSSFLTAGLTPGPQGPEGVGGGIARTFQGLIGAQQFQRQRAIQAATLPYQLAMPRLQAEDTLSQIQQRGSQAAFERSQVERNAAMQQHWINSDDARQQDADTRAQHQEDLEEKYNKDPVARLQATGGILGQLAVMQTPRQPKEDDAAYATRVAQAYTNLYSKSQGVAAGARTGGEKDVTQPINDQQSFLKNQFTLFQSGLPAKPEPHDKWSANLDNYLASSKNPNAYSEYAAKINTEREKGMLNWGTYQSSGVHKQGVSYPEYIAHPEKYEGAIQQRQQGSAPSTTAPAKNSGSSWTPSNN
jgi:hypothetical protein